VFLQKRGTVFSQIAAVSPRRIRYLIALETGPQRAVEGRNVKAILDQEVLPTHRYHPIGSIPLRSPVARRPCGGDLGLVLRR